jgi:plastocyanin
MRSWHHGTSLAKALLMVLLMCCGILGARAADVTAHVEFDKARKGKNVPDASNAVVWLTPLNPAEANMAAKEERTHPKLVQHNKQFEPHVLVVKVGSAVEFPNRDPFFHNVFSLFEGKRFDLGLYEAGTTRDVRFDRPGISYIFCNIHPEMSAVVIAVETPYYGISNRRGDMHIPNVPAGRYQMRVWSEASLPDDLKNQSRAITVSENTASLGTIRLTETPPVQAHKNKYGQDYEPPSPSSPAYARP